MNCQLCKLREANFLERQMGLLPEARLKPAPAFNHIMLDLFSPYMVRREVQKRTNGKEYGVMFTDLAVRAVHIERCLDMTQAISRWLSAGLQVSVDGRRKFTMIQFLNLWVQRGSSRKSGKRLIGSHYRESPRRINQLGYYLVLPIVPGIKETLNR